MRQTILGGGISEAVMLQEPSPIGDSLVIALSEEPASAVVWYLAIDARTEVDFFEVGRVYTNPPGKGDAASRAVALATCPGVRAWRVRALAPVGATAELSLISQAREGEGGGVGVEPLSGSADSLIDVGTNASSKVVRIGRTLLVGARGFQQGGAATRYLMFFDAAALPANGTAPIDTPIPLGIDGAFNFQPTNPIGLATGLTWAVSSTPNTLTLDAGATFRVVIEHDPGPVT